MSNFVHVHVTEKTRYTAGHFSGKDEAGAFNVVTVVNGDTEIQLFVSDEQLERLAGQLSAMAADRSFMQQEEALASRQRASCVEAPAAPVTAEDDDETFDKW